MMMRPYAWVGVVLLLAMPAWAAEPPKVEMGETTTHDSACALAESIASKLGYKGNVKHERAEHTCRALTPKMGDADRAEFMRCCLRKLEGGTQAPAPKAEPRKKAGNGV